MIYVLIVDDHPIILEGTKSLLKKVKDLSISLEMDPSKVINRILNESFDIFLIDVNMAKKDGISLAKDIKSINPQAKIILYTCDDLQSYYHLILEKTIQSVLSKIAPRERIISTIRSVMQDNIVLPANFPDYINNKMQNKYDNLKLTNKEEQLIRMIIDGMTNKMIAEHLNVSQRTVERYLTQLFNFLGVSSREEIIKLVQKEKLI
ncbi:response regulator transcription factor [Lysinibacillus xylanilyticus]|uniref:response regulator transcription factor n=1 Tax=Lysinibacillus xylanilyticus TaxID=582475 RepID=UPI002B25444C|nr:response regulator transcription factor [Lysinibacillus xylanilyticus]MEB2300425.1 response regulator transcription factor [Lysinibacillus xylanilyticus]